MKDENIKEKMKDEKIKEKSSCIKKNIFLQNSVIDAINVHYAEG